MHALAAPYLAAAALLVLAGGAKVVDPGPLVRALRSVGVPAPRLLVRAGAAAEVLLGAAALATASAAVAAGVALSYAAFTGFVLLALRRGGVLASCGCFGKADTPPTRTHAAVTAALAVSALAVAARPSGALPDLVAARPGDAVALVVVTAAVAATAYLALALLPMLRARA